MTQNKSVWIPRIPRTASTYLIDALRDASVEQDWKFFKKDQPATDVESCLTDYNCIYTGHNSYYTDRMQNWTKLLVIRRDVIGRFVSSYNYSNYLLDVHGKELVDIDTFIRCHQNWAAPETQELVQKNKGCWNPFLDTFAYLNFIQESHQAPRIENVLKLFDKIYFTENVDSVLHDLENVYGYNLKVCSDWIKNNLLVRNSGKQFLHINPIKVSDLTHDQLDNIMNIETIKREYKFLEVVLSELL